MTREVCFIVRHFRTI